MEDVKEVQSTEKDMTAEEAELVSPETAQAKREDQELLSFSAEQRAHNQKMERLAKITAGCMLGILAVVVLTAVLILPRVLGILSDAREITTQVQEMTGQAGEVLNEAQEVVTQIKEGDPKKLMDNINHLAKEGETAMQECVEQVKRAVDVLDKMDIDSLNTAIDNLGKAISPLAKLFGGR